MEPEKELRDQRPFTPSPLTLTPLDRNVLLQSKKNVGLTLLTLFTSCPWCPLPLATTSQRPLSLPSPPAPNFPQPEDETQEGARGCPCEEGWAERGKPSEGQTILRLHSKEAASQQPGQECRVCAHWLGGRGSSGHMVTASRAQDQPQSTIFSLW